MNENQTEAKAFGRYIRMSPNKVRRVLNQIRGKKYKDAKKSDEEEENLSDEEDEEYQKEYSKFPGADKIYHKIIWDEHLKEDDFSVIYEDRFEGNIEEPFCIFKELKEDIPFHRIRFYKQNGEIVWGRKDKINKL